MKRIAMILMVLFLSVGVASAAEITFAWDANIESDLAGYKLYSGKVSRFDPALITEYKLMNVGDGQGFYAATAYDTHGNESKFSEELSLVINTSRPGAPIRFKATIKASKVTVETD